MQNTMGSVLFILTMEQGSVLPCKEQGIQCCTKNDFSFAPEISKTVLSIPDVKCLANLMEYDPIQVS